MKKFHNKEVQVSLTEHDIWSLLKLFRDGELMAFPGELEQKIILAYHKAKLAALKSEKTAQYMENTPDIDEMLAAAENFQFADNALLAAWDAYILAIAECDSVQHYEPIPYQTFASVLKEFVKHYDMTPAMERIAREAETVPFEIRLADWTGRDVPKALEEMQELQADLENVEINTPLNNRLQAIDTSIKALEAVSDAYNHAKITDDDPSPSNIIEIEPTGRAVYMDIRSQIQQLQKQYQEDLEGIRESNEMELPIGDTLQEGRLEGVRAVIDLLTSIDNKYR